MNSVMPSGRDFNSPDEFFIAQVSGQLKARKMIGGPATVLRQLAMEPVAQDLQALADRTFSKRYGSCSAQREIKRPRTQRIRNSSDNRATAESTGNAKCVCL